MNINRTRKRLALLGCLLLAMTAGVCAQQDETDVPLMRVPGEKMTWKMTVALSTGSSPHNHPGVASLTIAKTGEVSKIFVAMKSGSTTQLWRVAHSTLYYSKERNRIFVIQDNPEEAPYPYASSGFYGIEHVKLADEQKITNFEQTPCRYFRGMLAIPRRAESGVADEAAPLAEYEAWFDLKTGLPKAYREKGQTFIYQFATTPEEVRLPAEYQAAADQNRADLMHAGILPQPAKAPNN